MPEDANRKWDDSLISMGLGALVVVVSGILLFNYFNNQAPKLVNNQKNANPTAQAQKSQSTSPSASAQAKTSGKPSASGAAKTATAESKTLPTKHTVVAGESMWALSEKYYGSGFELKRIAQANNLASNARLSTGQILEIPKVELVSSTSTVKTTPAPTQIAKASTSPSPSPKASASVKPSTSPTAVAQVKNATTTSSSSMTYTVERGDTLWSIAGAKCNDSYKWSSIAKQNKLVHPGVIHAGNVFTFTCE